MQIYVHLINSDCKLLPYSANFRQLATHNSADMPYAQMCVLIYCLIALPSGHPSTRQLFFLTNSKQANSISI
jgi:hypothetical protein